MLLIILAAVFLLACLCGGLLLFPSMLERVQQAISPRLPRVQRKRLALLAAGTGLVALPPALALLAAKPRPVSAVAPPPRLVNAQIASLLQGEQLAPPPALPPTVFTTAEVVLLRPMLDTANRNWQQLDSAFTQLLLHLFRSMRDNHGYEMALLEGYRSPERQNQLADAGPHVTNARAFQSYHQFGLAADCAFLRAGQLVISERDPWAMRGYQLYGQVAESLGLTWGGRWTMMDFGHIELRGSRNRP